VTKVKLQKQGWIRQQLKRRNVRFSVLAFLVAVAVLSQFSIAVGSANRRQLEVISRSPRILIARGIASKEECGHLIALAKQRGMTPARVQNFGDQNREKSQERSNTAAWLLHHQDEIVSSLEARLSKVTNMPVENGEAFQVLRYEPGQEFTNHLDADPMDQGQPGGNRVVTALLYLQAPDVGGETEFPMLGLKLRVETGDAVIFWNLKDDNTVNEDVLHAGLPPTRGEKWVATKWLHDQDYQAAAEAVFRHSQKARHQAPKPWRDEPDNDDIRANHDDIRAEVQEEEPVARMSDGEKSFVGVERDGGQPPPAAQPAQGSEGSESGMGPMWGELPEPRGRSRGDKEPQRVKRPVDRVQLEPGVHKLRKLPPQLASIARRDGRPTGQRKRHPDVLAALRPRKDKDHKGQLGNHDLTADELRRGRLEQRKAENRRRHERVGRLNPDVANFLGADFRPRRARERAPPVTFCRGCGRQARCQTSQERQTPSPDSVIIGVVKKISKLGTL